MPEQSEAIRVESGELQPVQPRQRIRELDVLRGFAIFGIFMVNIGMFAGPMGYAFMPGDMPGGMTTGGTISHSIVRGLFELKFVGLFSMMFGMGMAIQWMRAEQAGRRFVPLYLRRIALLGVFGFVHAIFLWYGDILFLYAWTALIALFFVRMQAASLLKLAIGALVLAVVCMVIITGAQFAMMSMQDGVESTDAAQSAEVPTAEVQEAESGGDEPAEGTLAQSPVEELIEIFKSMSTDPKGGAPNSESWLKAETMAYAEGPMSVTVIMRAVTYAFMFVFVILTGFGFRLLGMFLLGMALVKMRFFDHDRHELVRRMCLICLPLGLLGEGIVVAAGVMTGFSQGWHSLAFDSLHWLTSVVLSLGYASGMVLLYRSGAFRLLILGLEGVGRTALSNYLLQTLIATTIFYWWGFGLFGTMSRPSQLLLVVGIFAGQMIGSFIWLRVFRIGPFEWLWRSLTYLKLQPLRRVPPTAAA